MKDMNSKIVTASTVRRNLNVESATNVLDGAVYDLQDAVAALAEHLSPLLSPERPGSIGEDRQAGESEVAERIMSNAETIRGRAARIRELIDRL